MDDFQVVFAPNIVKKNKFLLLIFVVNQQQAKRRTGFILNMLYKQQQGSNL
jgi:hypothetical protein